MALVGNNTYYYEACKKQGLGRAGLHEILRSANTQLRVCQAGRRGVAEGVMKTNILVPSRGGKLIHFDYARPVKEIWTSAPEEETRAFL
ncbi:hypothetical protein HII31_11115 [Pseudocercospora fuligena]|uniref:Uncharacterized protein n=1 Tax=Pseudocercospora fuligena TaxID=685502 RepID=A0A8H6RCH1_9PEZI|nr:hypothetical protein HII31_11115 [Pseudocercospora fuligena]